MLKTIWVFDEHKLVSKLEAKLTPAGWYWPHGRELYWADGGSKRILVHTFYPEEKIVLCTLVSYDRLSDLEQIVRNMSYMHELCVWDTDNQETIKLVHEAGYGSSYEGHLRQKWEQEQRDIQLREEVAAREAAKPEESPSWTIFGRPLPTLESFIQIKENADGKTTTNIGYGCFALAVLVFAVVGFLGLFFKIVF